MELEEVYSRFHEIKGLVFSRQRGRSIRFGDHKSRFRGAGYDFAAIEQWRPGETLTGVSWKLSLKNYPDKIFRIRRIEPKEMPVDLVIDISSSMRFQILKGANKGRLLFELIGLLGFTGISRQDPVGAVGFSEGIEFFLRPKASRGQIFHIAKKAFERMQMSQLDENQSGPSDFNLPLRLIYRKFKFRHVVFVISDFVDAINNPELIDYDNLKRLSSRHHVIAIVLHDPEEFNWGRAKGVVLARNPETRRLRPIKASRAAWIRENIAEKKAAMITKFKECGVEAVELAYEDYFEKLTGFFAGKNNVFS
ncbi:MAG: hypothetical protein Q8R34_01475 [bacterium]|nr:hypothetical protein [bacterium]